MSKINQTNKSMNFTELPAKHDQTNICKCCGKTFYDIKEIAICKICEIKLRYKN